MKELIAPARAQPGQLAFSSPNTPDQFAAFVKSEVARWSKVIQDAGIKAD